MLQLNKVGKYAGSSPQPWGRPSREQWPPDPPSTYCTPSSAPHSPSQAVSFSSAHAGSGTTLQPAGVAAQAPWPAVTSSPVPACSLLRSSSPVTSLGRMLTAASSPQGGRIRRHHHPHPLPPPFPQRRRMSRGSWRGASARSPQSHPPIPHPNEELEIWQTTQQALVINVSMNAF